MTRHTICATLAAVTMTFATLGPQPAQAAPPGPSPRPILIPWSSPIEQEGVESVFEHAAGLGFMDGLELGLGVTTRLAGDEPVNSVAGMVATRLGALALGLGLGGVGDGPGTDTITTRVDVAWALRLSKGVSLGWHWHGLFNDENSALDHYDSWDMALGLRPTRGLAVSLELDRMNSPSLGGDELDPIFRIGIGVRPGTERLTLGIEASRTLGGDALWTVGGNARVMVIPGLVLGAYGRYLVAESGPARDRLQVGAMFGLYQGGMAFESSFDARDTLEGDNDSAMDLSMLLKAGSYRHPSLTTRGDVVFKITVEGPVAERRKPSFFSRGPATFGDWLTTLDILRRDPDIVGVLFDIKAAPSWAQIWELRAAIERLQAAGKRVHAVLTVADMKGFYLASAADKIHLYASGGLLLTGLSITRTYLLGLLQRLGLKAEFVKWQEFKSAPEALTRSSPSDPASLQTKALLDGVDKAWVDAVAQGRGLDRATIKRILDSGPQTMSVARQENLVDTLVDADAIDNVIREDVGEHAVITDRWRPAATAWRRWSGQRKIAIIPVVGSIIDGKSGDGLPIPVIGGQQTGDRSVIAGLEAATDSRDVVGIVVRVDSGGGSAVASDKMHNAVVKAAKRKPLIVSFGNAAASGGYYLAASAPKILTTPLTVTGSIGIFTGKVDLSGLYAMIGITTKTIKTNPRADMMRTHRGWTDTEREAAQQALKAYYDRFVGLVSKGRELPIAETYELARGRVYLGDEALKLKLCDAQGGLWDAIEQIRAQAGVDPDEPLGLAYLPTVSAFSSFQRFFAGVLGLETEEPATQHSADTFMGRLSTLAGTLKVIEAGGPLALLPWEIEIR